ncbi:uridine kinase family protein [Albibacterium profundi]|uniref:Uridine kinase n=1 Tax=Albibacterium profundi TaxID=3134906 RepID=A0ABV5CG49_9SPHI
MTRPLNKPYIIGVAGSSGSGKTEFLTSFSSNFNPGEIAVISQDDYYVRIQGLTKEENKLYNFDLPTAIDRQAFHQDIVSLINGKSITKEEYTFNNPNRESRTLNIEPAPILLIEGLFIYYFEEINELLDHRLFLHANNEIALERRIKRDAVERGYNKEDVTYKWHNHVVPAYEQYLEPYKAICNQIIENNSQKLTDIQQSAKDISSYLRQFFF